MSDHNPLRKSSSSLANVLSEARGMAATSFTPDLPVDKRPAKLLIPRRPGSPKTDVMTTSARLAQDPNKAPFLTTLESNVRPSEAARHVALPKGSSKQGADPALLPNLQKDYPSILPEGDKSAFTPFVSAAQNSTRKGRLGMLPPKNPPHGISQTTPEAKPTPVMAMEPIHSHLPPTQSQTKGTNSDPTKTLAAIKGHTITAPPTKPSKDSGLDRNPNTTHRRLKQTTSPSKTHSTKSRHLNAILDTELEVDINPYYFDIIAYLPYSPDDNFERLSLYCQ